ncbi:MAG: amidohydrolase family protein [Verrucomicrobia bacterium]|nr:amidohydrolase family protein [Verrucomicrobiota bacterium]
MTAYRCRLLIPLDGDPIHEAAFVVEENRFAAVGPVGAILDGYQDRVIDLGPTVVLPGLINAHCHLDYSLMRGAILPSRSFSHWVGRINALKGLFSDNDYVRATELGLAELQRHGTTTVLNVAAIPQILPRLTAPRLRTYMFLELIDVRPRPGDDDYAFGSWLIFEPEARPALGGFGLSPHAPYTASAPLYRLALECTQRFGWPLTTHVAESDEEFNMFTERRGPLFELLQKIGRPMDDCGGITPLRHLLQSGSVGPESILVHLNRVDQEDLDWLSRPEWQRLTVVHCPKSHRFLHHSRFPLEALRERGINVALGTDSLASNDSLNLFAEMRTVLRNYPLLSAEAVLRMATVDAARALGLEHELGSITPGYLADAIGLPCPTEMLDFPYELVLQNRSPVTWMLVNGRALSS